jgi:hypothetical protein
VRKVRVTFGPQNEPIFEETDEPSTPEPETEDEKDEQPNA